MTEASALKILETMPKTEFQAFFKSLPERVKLLVRSGIVNWQETLPQWYIKLSINKTK